MARKSWSDEVPPGRFVQRQARSGVMGCPWAKCRVGRFWCRIPVASQAACGSMPRTMDRRAGNLGSNGDWEGLVPDHGCIPGGMAGGMETNA